MIEVIYKDFSKAFDTLQPSKLLSALSYMVPGSIIQRCLDSSMVDTMCGMTLPNLYLHSVQSWFATGDAVKTSVLVSIYNSYTPDADITMYADDITCSNPLSTSCDSKLQATIDWGLQWSSSNCMQLNLDKTKAKMITLQS